MAALRYAVPAGIAKSSFRGKPPAAAAMLGAIAPCAAAALMPARISRRLSFMNPRYLPGCEPLEAAVCVPRRPRRVVCHTAEQRHDHAVEFRRGLEVHRLIEIVGRLMIPLAHPRQSRLLILGAEFVPELEGQCRDAAADEAVLIAADEPILIRLAIGLDFDAELARHDAHGFPQRRLSETLHLDHLQWIQRQEHVEIDVGDDLVGWNRRMRREVARSEQPFLFGGDSDEEDRAPARRM